jgi:hypothetical protein
MNYTNIRLNFNTRDRLKKMGLKGESYDFIINQLIDLKEKTQSENQ